MTRKPGALRSGQLISTERDGYHADAAFEAPFVFQPRPSLNHERAPAPIVMRFSGTGDSMMPSAVSCFKRNCPQAAAMS